MNQFKNTLSSASGLTHSRSHYTAEMFLQDFPQFTGKEGEPLAPRGMLNSLIDNAASSISPERWFDKWRYACGLHTAHYLTLYLQTYAEYSVSPVQAAASGAAVGVVKSATLGDSSVTYDTESVLAATDKWGGLNATRYGQLLATEARLIGIGGTFVI